MEGVEIVGDRGGGSERRHALIEQGKREEGARAARARGERSGDEREQGRLARASVADYRDAFRPGYRQGQVADDGPAGDMASGDMVEVEDGARGGQDRKSVV